MLVLNSDNFKLQIAGTDISSPSTPYAQGDQTFGESLDLLRKICEKIDLESNLIDSISFDMRNNINTYLSNIFSWLQNNPFANWPSIFSHVNTVYQWLLSWGVNIYEVGNIEEIKNSLRKINIKESEIIELKNLSNDLMSIKIAATRLEDAKSLTAFVNNSENFKDLDATLEEANQLIDKLKSTTEKVDAYNNSQEFASVKEIYHKQIFGFFGLLWKVIITILIFIINLGIVIYCRDFLKICIKDHEIIELIANGTIRMLCLSPSLYLMNIILSLYNRSYKLMVHYEFKSIISKTHLGTLLTLERFMESSNLENNKTKNEIIQSIYKEIYNNPLTISQNETSKTSIQKELYEIKISDFAENLSFLEKLKNFIRSETPSTPPTTTPNI